MKPYERLIFQLNVLQSSINLDWGALETSTLTAAEFDQVREAIRGTREAMTELAARLEEKFGEGRAHG